MQKLGGASVSLRVWLRPTTGRRATTTSAEPQLQVAVGENLPRFFHAKLVHWQQDASQVSAVPPALDGPRSKFLETVRQSVDKAGEDRVTVDFRHAEASLYSPRADICPGRTDRVLCPFCYLAD